MRANRQEEEEQGGGSDTPDQDLAKVEVSHDGHRLQQAAEEGRPRAGRGASLDGEDVDAPISTTKSSSSAPVSTAKAGPVNLTKRGETVNLSKSSSGATVRLNLNWNQRPAGGGGGGS